MNLPQGFIDWLSTISVWDVISWAIIIGVILRFIFRKGWRSVTALAKGVMSADKILDAVKDLPDDMADLKTQVADIHHEMYNNSGDSLRDQVDKANKRLGYVEDALGLTRHDDTNVSDI